MSELNALLQDLIKELEKIEKEVVNIKKILKQVQHAYRVNGEI